MPEFVIDNSCILILPSASEYFNINWRSWSSGRALSNTQPNRRYWLALTMYLMRFFRGSFGTKLLHDANESSGVPNPMYFGMN